MPSQQKQKSPAANEEDDDTSSEEATPEKSKSKALKDEDSDDDDDSDDTTSQPEPPKVVVVPEPTREKRKKKSKGDAEADPKTANGEQVKKGEEKKDDKEAEPEKKKRKKDPTPEVEKQETATKASKKKKIVAEEKQPSPEVVKVEKVEDTQGKASGAKRGQHHWQPKEELALAQQMLEDLKSKPGLNFHSKVKTDDYWDGLYESLKGKLSNDFSTQQIFDKHKRMLGKYKKQRSDPFKKRTGNENALYQIFKQLYGNGEELTAAKAGTSGFKSGVHSDADEDSNGGTTGLPLLSTIKEALEGKFAGNGKAIVADNHQQAANGGGDLSRMMKSFMLEQTNSDPVISFGTTLCSGVESLMKSYKLGFEASNVNRDVRKRLLQEQAAEYAAMKRRLKLVLDFCELEEEVLKKKLESFR